MSINTTGDNSPRPIDRNSPHYNANDLYTLQIRNSPELTGKSYFMLNWAQVETLRLKLTEEDMQSTSETDPTNLNRLALFDKRLIEMKTLMDKPEQLRQIRREMINLFFTYKYNNLNFAFLDPEETNGKTHVSTVSFPLAVSPDLLSKITQDLEE